jgi:tetratricopeptide (TPR) repeat protein
MWRAFLLATLIVPTSVFGQDNSGWIGKRVITHYGAVLQIGNQVVDDEKRSTNLTVSGNDKRLFRIYRVEHVNGSWLWLKAEKEGVEGWMKAEFVIPYDQAIEYFTNQIQANPRQSTWYNCRGNVWQAKGEYDIAIADFNEAIRLEPGDETPFNNRGTAWDDKKDYDKAIEDYTESIRLEGRNPEAFSNRGLSWRKKKEYDKAIADYSEAIRINPIYAQGYTGRGDAWYFKKEYDKAMADYNEAIRIDPKSAIAYEDRGDAWRGKKDYDKAIADYNEAIRIDPSYAIAYVGRGLGWRAKMEYDKAIADYDEAIRLDPKDAAAYNSRACLWATCPDEKYRDGNKALESATRACELSKWSDAIKISTLAEAYAEAGNYDKAVEWQEKAISLFTNESSKRKGEAELKLFKNKKPYHGDYSDLP